ncbi:hypothetical protein KUTeg_000677 [Tegillarca granosa]|uniref:L-xylulose reductase n=1 Tax=Tegillarca granosa TaxID=220873 RepID=A0ABQ9FY83_TEGGR|nr:hypothetical protein KUTeg_000677 [Tegillarca granosa]
MSFQGKRALVTGGSRGIGRGIVEALLKEGAEVFAIGKQKENLEKLKTDLPDVHIIQVDLANWSETRQKVEDIGHIDVLVNNAAIGLPPTPFGSFDKEGVDRTLDVNLKAPFNVSQIVCRDMIKRGSGGSIVNISSIGSTTATKDNAIYCMSKAGLDMMTKVMALELGPHKIRVNSVNPTITMTEMGKKFWKDPERLAPWSARTPLGRFSEVEDVVAATLFLLSEKASMITGTTLPVDGGYLVS